HQPGRMQLGLGPSIAPAEAVVLLQVLVEVLDAPASVVRAVLLQQPGDLVDRHPPRRGFAQAPIEEPLQALLLVALPEAPELSFRPAVQVARLLRRHLPCPCAALLVAKLLHPSCL